MTFFKDLTRRPSSAAKSLVRGLQKKFRKSTSTIKNLPLPASTTAPIKDLPLPTTTAIKDRPLPPTPPPEVIDDLSTPSTFSCSSCSTSCSVSYTWSFVDEEEPSDIRLSQKHCSSSTYSYPCFLNKRPADARLSQESSSSLTFWSCLSSFVHEHLPADDTPLSQEPFSSISYSSSLSFVHVHLPGDATPLSHEPCSSISYASSLSFAHECLVNIPLPQRSSPEPFPVTSDELVARYVSNPKTRALWEQNKVLPATPTRRQPRSPLPPPADGDDDDDDDTAAIMDLASNVLTWINQNYGENEPDHWKTLKPKLAAYAAA